MNKRLLTLLIMGTVGVLTLVTVVANNSEIFLSFYDSSAANSLSAAQGDVVTQLNDVASQLYDAYGRSNSNYATPPTTKENLRDARTSVRRARSYVIRKRYPDATNSLNTATSQIDKAESSVTSGTDIHELEDIKEDISMVLLDIIDLKNGATTTATGTNNTTADGSFNKFPGTPACDRARLLGELQIARNKRIATSANFPGATAKLQCADSGDWRYVYSHVFPIEWAGNIITEHANTREDCSTLAAAAKKIELAAYAASPDAVYAGLATSAGYNNAIFNDLACKPTTSGAGSVVPAGGPSRGGQGATPANSAACAEAQAYSSCAIEKRQSCINSTATECEFYCNAQTIQNSGGERTACNTCNAQHFTACLNKPVTEGGCGRPNPLPAGTICTTP